MGWTGLLMPLKTAIAAFAFQKQASQSSTILQKLGPRLSAVYRLVPSHAKGIVDVGCDHALLGLALAAGRDHPNLRKVIGIDKALDPLDVARQNLREHAYSRIEKYPLTASLELRHGDGLEALIPEDVNIVDTLCMAGLGSGTIIEVLSSLKYVREGAKFKYLVLQPFDSRPHYVNEVRDCVKSQGFSIQQERIDYVNSRWFVTMAASVNANKADKAGQCEKVRYNSTCMLGDALMRLAREDRRTHQIYADYLCHHRDWYASICKARNTRMPPEHDYVSQFLRAIEQEISELRVH